MKKVTAASLMIALGIIYGDIGTSPLYTFKAIIGSRQISEMLVLGGVSCVFWTLVLQTSIKYVWLTLQADNEGEGGIFSLYALVRKYGRKLVIPTMVGASALLADGIITPAVTVSSAVEGLVQLPAFSGISTVPLVLIILSLVFFFQRFGTEKVGKAFGPVMLIWFAFLLVSGLKQVLLYPEVLKALNPVYAKDLLTKYPGGYWLLGAVFLCTTGAEALYSDLGHCGKKNIHLTWVFVKLCLIVQYFGQAAWLLTREGQYLGEANPFFGLIPQELILPGVLLATLAAIIASQALISGSFTLVNEAINLNFWQRVMVKQPSEAKGQIYIPSVNTLLWIGGVFVVLYFQNSARMEAAYGLAITITMLMTTFLLAYFLRYKLHWNKWTVWTIVAVFTAVELGFFVANLMKFMEGGYITVLVGFLFLTIMYTSFEARKINNRYTRFVPLGKYASKIVELSQDVQVPLYSTHLVYLTKADHRDQVEQIIMDSIFSPQPKKAKVYWLYHINRTNNPYTLNYEISELVHERVIKIVLNIGFRLQPRSELYFKKILQDLIERDEMGLASKVGPGSKYSKNFDYTFVVLDKYISVENEFNFHERWVLNTFFGLKKYVQKDDKAFGIDKPKIETVPLVFHPAPKLSLVRN
ncbi:potassium transporter [Leadbetterella byssophila DSM 17132]|uniref:Potassium transporter n=1 Tax=Leadbetterella byssophila (strain DSM 17132 / JCM 16389 / KACC 11308 / NBRC 106382 / 4M15) TaxID=649349 RepID=E4RUD8_LEAB4|nr:KUP/HAK/KT family potassium transporter [Leadbetterella byssophila]ADQ17829.1 potassium transporter [Leadbetterella byssophila DSM 17132]